MAAGAVGLGAARAALAQSTWNGGAGNWSDASKWTGGVPNSPITDVFIDGGNAINSSVLIDDPANPTTWSFRNLTLDAGDSLSFKHVNPASPGLVLYGNAVINGTFTINPSAPTAQGNVTMKPGSSFSGTGSIVNSLIHLDVGSTGSNGIGAGLLIHGQSAYLSGLDFTDSTQKHLVNYASITNDLVNSGRFYVENASNRGTIKTLSGTALYLSQINNELGGSIFHDGPGGSNISGSMYSVVNLAGGTITLHSGNVLGGGLTNGAGALFTVDSAATLNTGDFNNAAGGNLVINGLMKVTGPFANTGNITLRGTLDLFPNYTVDASFPYFSISHGTNGALIFDGRLDNTGNTLTLDPVHGDMTLSGVASGRLIGGTVASTGGRLLMNGGGIDGVTFNTGSAGAVVPAAGALVAYGNFNLLNSTIAFNTSLTAGSQLSFFGSGDQAVTGTGELLAGNSANPAVAVSVSNGNATFGPGILMHGGSMLFANNLTNQGAVRMETPGGFFKLQGFFDNQGTVSVAANALLWVSNASGTVGSSFVNHGTLQIGAGSTVRVNAAGALNSPSGITIDSTVTLTGDQGSIGGNTLVNGIVDPASLSGTATNGLGKLTFNGNLAFASGSHYRAQIGSFTAVVAASDELVVNGNLDLSAPNDTLDLLGNPALEPIGTYVLVAYSGSLTGTFDNVTGLGPNEVLSYATPNEITLTVTPEPTAIGLLGLAGAALFTRPRRGKHPRRKTCDPRSA